MSQTKNIADLIETVCAEKLASEVSLLDVETALRPGRAAQKNASLRKYEDAMCVLRDVISGYSGGIYVSGPNASAFADIAEDEAPAITLDADEMYANIATAWWPTVRVDKRFALDSLPAFLGGVNATLFPLGVRTIAPPDFGKRFGSPVKSFEDAVALTRDILRATVGDDLNVLFLRNRLAEKCVAAAWDLKFITVVVLNSHVTATEETQGLFDLLFPNRSIRITTTKDAVDNNDVLIACKHLRAKVSGKTPEPETDQTETSPETDQTETSPDESDQSNPNDTDQTETISPRTGKPIRKYTRKPTNPQ